jgi:hypothetical protein
VRLGFLIALLISSRLAAQPAPARHDYLIIPESRIGPYILGSGHAGLRKAFGAANVVDELMDSDEGTVAQGTIVYKGDRSRELRIVWVKDDRSQPILAIDICQQSKTCRWHTKDGITLGTTAARLEALNGRPYLHSGFAWDYSGGITSWDGGKLERELQRGGRLMLFLDYLNDGRLSEQEKAAIAGDRTLRSDRPEMGKVRAYVAMMRLFVQ